MKVIERFRMKWCAKDMVKGTELDWKEVLRYAGIIDGECRYELSLGIIENKPLWKGDTYYYRGTKRVACSSMTKGFYSNCTWEPPFIPTIPTQTISCGVGSLASSKQKTKYTKINSLGYMYYVRTELLPSLAKDLLTAFSGDASMMQFSDFVIDNSTNKAIKCRSNIEDVFDCYTGN